MPHHQVEAVYQAQKALYGCCVTAGGVKLNVKVASYFTSFGILMFLHFPPLQFSYCPFLWEEDAVPWLCRFTAESHEAHASARPG